VKQRRDTRILHPTLKTEVEPSCISLVNYYIVDAGVVALSKASKQRLFVCVLITDEVTRKHARLKVSVDSKQDGTKQKGY